MQKVIREISVKTKARGFTRMAVALSIALAWLPLARATAPDTKCPDGKTADGLERAGNSKHCVVIRKFEPAGASARVLVVFLHADNGGSMALPVDSSGTAFNLSQQLKATTIALQRPGYRSELGLSDGTTSAQDDDYTPGNVELLAAALDRLRALNPGKKVLLIGHAGGAAMAALLSSRFPASADAYLLAACPCDVAKWRQWRNASASKVTGWK